LEIPSIQTAPLDSKNAPLTLDNIKDGQYFYAKVISQSQSKQEIVLRLGNQLLNVKSSVLVATGQTIKVLAEQTPSELILKIPPPVNQTESINKFLRLLLPKQASVHEFQQPLNQVLASLQKQPSPRLEGQTIYNGTKHTEITRLAANIIKNLPSYKHITNATELKKIVQNSGVFFEPNLRQAISSSTPAIMEQLLQQAKHIDAVQPSDLKANLVKLIQLLKNWPTSPHTKQLAVTKNINPALLLDTQVKALIEKSEGALSKITLNQLASTNTESSTGTSRQTWQIEIPFFNNQQHESIFIKIEQEGSNNKKQRKNNPIWSVSLEITPPKLGAIKSKLTFADQKVSSTFWTDSAETRLLIQQHLNLLEEQFKQAGIDLEKIHIQQGSGVSIQKAKPSTPILNEKA